MAGSQQGRVAEEAEPLWDGGAGSPPGGRCCLVPRVPPRQPRAGSVSERGSPGAAGDAEISHLETPRLFCSTVASPGAFRSGQMVRFPGGDADTQSCGCWRPSAAKEDDVLQPGPRTPRLSLPLVS